VTLGNVWSCRVDDRVESVEGVGCDFNDAGAVLRFSEVELKGGDAVTFSLKLIDEGHCFCGISAKGERHSCAFSDELGHDGSSNSPRAASDERTSGEMSEGVSHYPKAPCSAAASNWASS
jgi:hypothetical protein